METGEILAAIQEAAETIATPNYAAWLSAVAALGAVIVTIIIAIKQNKVAERQNEITKKQNEIAEKQAEISGQQNKIALFKERYLVYCEFQKIINICFHVSSGHMEKEKLIYILKIIYGINIQSEDADSYTDICSNLFIQFKMSEYQMQQAVFLFNDIEERDINALFRVRLGLLSFLTKKDNLPGTIFEEFIEKCNYFEKKYMATMKKQLNLK